MRNSNILLNSKILRFAQVHLINSEGKSIGIVSSKEALLLAEEEGLDLFAVSTSVNPPVCKIVDYHKYKYEEDKKAKAASKPKQQTKEIKISPRIHIHDLEVCIKRGKKFLEHGDKVKISCILKQREQEHPNVGFDKINTMLEAMQDVCQIESEPTLATRALITTTLIPRKK